MKQQQPRLCSRGCCCHIVFLFHARHFRERGDALRKLGVGGDVVGHLAVVERLIGGHVEVAYAGIEQRRGLMFHVRAEIVLCLRHIGFVEIDLVGDVPVFHGVLLPSWLPSQGHSPAETSYRIHTVGGSLKFVEIF